MRADCPCCGDEMDAEMIVCWECFKLSNRLSPGEHEDILLTTGYKIGTFVLTEEEVELWSSARDARMNRGEMKAPLA